MVRISLKISLQEKHEFIILFVLENVSYCQNYFNCEKNQEQYSV